MMSAATTSRPIQEFVSAQGTYDAGFLFVPPDKNYVGWTDPKHNLGLTMDYAGLSDQSLGGTLGTTFSGSVSETRQADGTAIVRVLLVTSNALTFAMPPSPAPTGNPFGDNPLVFGTRTTDVLSGATPALGNCTLKVSFTEAHAGDPLPDLMVFLFGDTAPGQNLLSIGFQGTAAGTFADGSAGIAKVSEVGLLNTNPDHPPGVNHDAFPAENITLVHTGGNPAAPTTTSMSFPSDPAAADHADLISELLA
jgi:hypothetical protein